MLSHWYSQASKERKLIQIKLLQFDENGDNLFQFNEFEKVMLTLEPNLPTKFILTLFKNTMASQIEKLDAVTLENLTNIVIDY